MEVFSDSIAMKQFGNMVWSRETRCQALSKNPGSTLLYSNSATCKHISFLQCHTDSSQQSSHKTSCLPKMTGHAFEPLLYN